MDQLLRAILLEAAFACLYGQTDWYFAIDDDSCLREVRFNNLAIDGAKSMLTQRQKREI